MHLLTSQSVQSFSRVRLFATPWITARQASLSITNSWSLPKLMSIKSEMLSSHLILCRPLLLLPSIPPSIRGFSNESVLCIRWPKYWSFSFSISPSNGHPGLISFRMDWLDLLAVQGTLKSLLQLLLLLLLSHFSRVTLCDPIDGSPPGSPSLGFSRQEHWSGLPFPSPMHEREKWKESRSVVSDSFNVLKYVKFLLLWLVHLYSKKSPLS